jgi:ribosomal protein S18 acetylase RimI-like enzyme
MRDNHAVPHAPIPSVRKAEPADADALARFAERVFRETFGPFNAPDDMDLYCLQSFSTSLQAAEIVSPLVVTLLLIAPDAGIVGYAQLREGPPPVEIQEGSAIELVRFYIDTPLHGSGLSRRLMDAVIDEARSRDRRTLWLGVWERNARAIAFYRKAGFTDAGAHAFLLGSDLQTDRLMTRGIPQ